MKRKLVAAVVLCLTSVPAFAADNCKAAAKNLSPMMAIAVKGMDVKEDVLRATAADAEKRFATKCAAAPAPEKDGPVVACLAKATTLGALDKCPMKNSAPDKWAETIVNEMKK